MKDPTGSWTSRLWQSVLVLLIGAVGARVVWELLQPLLPVLSLLAVLLAVIGLLSGRWGR